MRRTLLAILGASVVETTGYPQDSLTVQRADGSAAGTVLLVLRDRPSGKRAQILREPKYLAVPQRSILFFSPQGTAAELALALAAFDRIRAEDGEVIKRRLTTENIGTVRPTSSDPAKDAVNQPYKDEYLQAMQSLLDWVHSRPEREVRGLGKLRWIQIDRPALASKQ